MGRATAPSEIPLPITYTPTTHRISKAKKGKRVHACEYAGCNKVFTRAEHKRRHELNHNPEALYRCSYAGCKKAFHRNDLLTRHMERHELEAQVESTAPWQRSASSSIPPEQYGSRCDVVTPTPGPFLAVTLPPSSILKAPQAIRPDLATNNLLWTGLQMPSEHQTTPLFPPPSHLQGSIEDTRFYSTPEACSSPSSDGTALSVPSYPGSSVSSTPSGVIDPYAEPIIDSEFTSSPVPMHATIHGWDQAETNVAPTSIISMSIDDALIRPTVHYQQSWPIPNHMGYNQSFLQPVPYGATTGAKPWCL